GFGGQRRIDQVGDEVGHALLEPALERRARAVDRVDVGAVQQAAFVQVDGEHLAGPELAFRDDALRRAVEYTGFGSDDELARIRQQPARRPQAVAIERAGGVAAVAHYDAGRSVPGVERETVVLVESREVRVDVFQRGGRRWNQDAHRLQQVHAADQQRLEHVVQALRVGTVQRHQQLQLPEIQPRRGPARAARQPPVPIALDRIDLAVVR